jgi:chromosome segregation ATPase
MYLKSLELSGFKSFAKKSSLTFTSSITGIVGPNGSGKSNTAEAFRFVLGEQSIKSLRGKRGEDMIWNGSSDSGGRVNRAQVKLVFDNSGKLFPTIDFDEVTIERIVHRDNTNEYLLNGTQVRLKDIHETLAAAHIGASGHHIISQGEADRILTASIRERREIIEDALGLKLYQWKKLESMRKLEKTDENIERVMSLRREIAPHIKFLKKQVEKVEKAQEMKRELTALYREYFAYQDLYIRIEKQHLNGEILGPRGELAELERSLEKAKKILLDSKSKDKKSDQVVVLEEKMMRVRTEKDGIVRELGRLEGEIAANTRAVEKERLRVHNEESRTVYLKDVEKVVQSIEGRACEQENIISIEHAKSFFGDIILALRTFISSHRTHTDSDFIGEALKEVEKLTKEQTHLEKKLEASIADETSLAQTYDELKLTIEREKDTDRDAEKDVFRIIARQNEVRHVVNDLNAKIAALGHVEATFKNELGEAGIIVGREAVDFGSYAREFNIGAPGSTPRLASEQESVHRSIDKLKIRLEDSGAAGGAEVMKEYKETEERDAFLAREIEDLEKAKIELLALIADLDARIEYEFKSGILKINTEFQNFFALMFGGGKAELTVVREVKRKKKSDMAELGELTNESDGSSSGMGGSMSSDSSNEIGETEQGLEGLDVNVSLPRKKVKGLMMLSGGERALTSIALLFAISQVNPPPFIILDETDAALDEANSKKYGDMIENLSQHSQLILITHNRETMSRAGTIYGVTMGNDGASRLLSIQFDEAVKVAK